MVTKKSEKTTKTAKTKSKETKVKSEPKSKSKKKIKEKTDQLSILDNSIPSSVLTGTGTIFGLETIEI